MPTSGTYNGITYLADIGLDVFERIGLRPTDATTQHYASLRRSMNIVQARWSNRGVNLWEITQYSVPMPQGQVSYAVPSNVIDVMPQSVFLRQYAMASPASATSAVFTTANGSVAITLGGIQNTTPVGGYVLISIPTAIGGIVLNGFYQVISATGTSIVFNAATAATATVTAQPGVLPTFTTTAGSSNVSVNLPNHGLLAGQTFDVQQATSIAGLNLQGNYTIQSVTDANDFVISTFPYTATVATSVTENDGQLLYATQNGAVDPVDILLYPMGRDEYAAVPDKAQQGRPTAFWFDRLNPNGNLWIWQVPDQYGPYELHYYAFTYMQDSIPTGLNQLDAPFRFLGAYVDEVAVDMAVKFAPERLQILQANALRSWKEASQEDREKVPLHYAPDFSTYFGRS